MPASNQLNNMSLSILCRPRNKKMRHKICMMHCDTDKKNNFCVYRDSNNVKSAQNRSPGLTCLCNTL